MSSPASWVHHEKPEPVFLLLILVCLGRSQLEGDGHRGNGAELH